MKKLIIWWAFIFVLSGIGFTQDESVSIKAGTLGAGVEAIKPISDKVEARIGINYFSYDYDTTESGIKYDLDLDLMSAGALIDYRPFNNKFFISAGVLWNDNEADLTAKYTGIITIGDNTYTLTQAGTVKGSLSFDDVAPYLGIGWRTPAKSDSSWSFTFELGVLYQGSPSISLTADGSLASNSSFVTDLEKERCELEDDLDDYKYYPVISFGLTKKF